MFGRYSKNHNYLKSQFSTQKKKPRIPNVLYVIYIAFRGGNTACGLSIYSISLLCPLFSTMLLSKILILSSFRPPIGQSRLFHKLGNALQILQASIHFWGLQCGNRPYTVFKVNLGRARLKGL